MADEQKTIKYGYKCPWTGKVIEEGHKSLIGLGNPPRSPFEPVGAGSVAMDRVIIPESPKTSSEQK